ncbi:hypothetical protein [Pseudoalteromonas sp. Z1A8]|uniref:hypothetical protein n=1 Tax=Pseudoalteromonas sp. Z1A8 TaxID=2686354 RepID=UPI00140A0A2A|nr:hypothetical protein [Pseudoalteromonas sp. Z1A8]
MDKRTEAYLFYEKYKAKPISSWKGATKKQRFKCEAMLDGNQCGCIFENSYSKLIVFFNRWRKKLEGHDLYGVMCPTHRKAFAKSRTKYAYYENMSNFGLVKLALKNRGKGKIYKHCNDNVHYLEMLRRKNEDGLTLIDLINEHLGARRLRPELQHYTLDDWRAYLKMKKFFNKSEWKRLDSHTQMLCHRQGYMPQLTKEFFSTSLIFESHTHAVIHCASYAELVFAKVLDELRLDYKAHPEWPFWFKNESYKCKADFIIILNGKVVMVEIWMLRKDLISKADLSDELLQNYLQRRKYKELKIKECAESAYDIFINVEARILRNDGLEAYLIEIKKILKSLNIKNIECISPSLFTDVEKLLFKLKILDVEELISYAKLNNFHYFTQFDNHLEKSIRKNPELQNKLERALAKEFNRVPNSRFFVDPPVADIILFVSARKELHSKEAYMTAHSNGQLPDGFMGNPIAKYPELKNWRQLWGEPLLVSYTEAKQIVSNLQIKGKTDFTRRRVKVKKSLDKNDPDFELLKIRANPGNHISGGYDEFTTWDEFTGDTDAIKQKCRKIELKQFLDIIQGGELMEITNQLTSLSFSSPTELRKILGEKASDALAYLKNAAFIDLILFGKTNKHIKDLNILVSYVPESAYVTENEWQKQRKVHIAYRLFPSKLGRHVISGEEVSWSKVKGILKKKSDNRTPIGEWFLSNLKLLEQLTNTEPVTYFV